MVCVNCEGKGGAVCNFFRTHPQFHGSVSSIAATLEEKNDRSGEALMICDPAIATMSDDLEVVDEAQRKSGCAGYEAS